MGTNIVWMNEVIVFFSASRGGVVFQRSCRGFDLRCIPVVSLVTTFCLRWNVYLRFGDASGR